MSDYSDDSDTSSSEEEEEIEVPEEVPAKKERKKYVRKPMTEEQKETLKERLAVARDAKKKKSILKQTDDYEEPVVKQPKKVKEVEPSPVVKKVKKEKEVVPITIAIDPVENKKNDKQTIVNNYYYNTPAPSSTPVKPVKTPKTKPVKKIDIPEQVIDTPLPTRRYYNPF